MVFVSSLGKDLKFNALSNDILSLINYSAQWIPYRGGVMIGYKF